MMHIQSQLRTWIYRHARPLEMALWQYHFEGGSKEAVLATLQCYQNADGGFGHGLEADNWNPESNPIATHHALKILQEIGFDDQRHPVYQGIRCYLASGHGRTDYGWMFVIPSNSEYPCAPWWDYSEEQNRREYVGVTAGLSAYVLKHCREAEPLYSKARAWANELLDVLLSGDGFGDMGLEGLIELVEAMTELGMIPPEDTRYHEALREKVKAAIDGGAGKWHRYGIRPSNYICDRESPFCKDNAALVMEKVRFLRETLPKDDVWDITWQWYRKMDRYGAEFALSRTWWKAARAIGNLRFLQAFSECE